MKNESKPKKSKMWINHKGESVPDKYVDFYDKKKEKIINQMVARANKLNEVLEEYKKLIFEKADGLFDDMFKAHNMEKTTQRNFTLYSFDKSLKIEISTQDIVDFDDRIQLAQAKINEFLELKTQGADPDLSIIINNAFKTSKGRLDKSRIFGLFSLKITHHLWNEAMDLIKQSITTNNTRRYATLWRRQQDGKYVQIQLNFSAL